MAVNSQQGEFCPYTCIDNNTSQKLCWVLKREVFRNFNHLDSLMDVERLIKKEV